MSHVRPAGESAPTRATAPRAGNGGRSATIATPMLHAYATSPKIQSTLHAALALLYQTGVYSTSESHIATHYKSFRCNAAR